MTRIPRGLTMLLFAPALLLLPGCGDDGGTGAAGRTSGNGDPDGALIVVLSGDDRLQLFDPTLPKSATNPVTVDTAVPQANPGIADLPDRHGVVEVQVGDVDSGSGAISNRRVPRLVYAKSGSVFAVNALRGGSHAPVRISAIGDACRVVHVAVDHIDPIGGSWVLVWRTGPDAACGEPGASDDTFSAIRLDAATSDAGIVLPPSLVHVETLYDAAGGIVGFLTREEIPSSEFPEFAAPYLVRRNADLGNPVTLQPAERVRSTRKGTSLVYLFVEWTGHTTLHRYDVSAQTLVALHTFAGNFVVPWVAYDADNIYFSDSNFDYGTSPPKASGTLYRMAHGSTTAIVLTRSTTRALYPSLPTRDRVVFYGLDPSWNESIYSVAKGASDATPTVLLDIAGGYAGLWWSDPSGLVYLNVVSLVTGSVAAVRVRDDGSGLVRRDNAGWIHGQWSSTMPETSPVGLESLVLITATAGGAELESIDAATGNTNLVLGSIAGASVTSSMLSFSSSGADRYEPLVVQVARAGGTVDLDAFVADHQTANSLTAISIVAGQSDTIFGGGGN